MTIWSVLKLPKTERDVASFDFCSLGAFNVIHVKCNKRLGELKQSRLGFKGCWET